MSEVSRLLIRRAIADVERSAPGSPANREINNAYAAGLIDLADAENCIHDYEAAAFRQQLQLAKLAACQVPVHA